LYRRKKTEAKESDPERLLVKVNRFNEFPRSMKSIQRKQELAPLRQLSLNRWINFTPLGGTDGGEGQDCVLTRSIPV